MTPPQRMREPAQSRFDRVRESAWGWFIAYFGMALQLIGSYAIGFALSRTFLPANATGPARLDAVAYHAAGCGACPGDASISSVEVQQRQGSTLFIARGTWPSSVDHFAEQVRLDVGDISVVLKPHGSQNAFEIVSFTKGGQDYSKTGSVSAGFVPGALVINLAPQLAAPMSFDLGLWNGSSFVQRVPAARQLTWSGYGAPQAAAGTSPSPPPATPTASQPPPAELSLVESCVYNGSLPAYLHFTGVASGMAVDPVTKVATPAIGAAIGAPLLRRAILPPFVIVGVVQSGGGAPATGSSAIDGAGNVQFLYYWDGVNPHKAWRTWDAAGKQWKLLEGTAAGAINFLLDGAKGIEFFWAGLHNGDKFGFIAATPQGCAATALDSALQPAEVISGA